MLFVKRFSALHLRNSKMPQRFQSSRRPTVPLGSRILLNPDKVFDHNMWDHMQWSREEEERAKEKAIENSLIRVQPELQEILPEGKRDHYIKRSTTKHMTFTGLLEDNNLCEDNSVVKASSVQGNNFSPGYNYSAAGDQSVKCIGKRFPGSDAAYRILEVGCGAGNSVFPILEVTRHNPRVFLYCCDFASEAVELIKSHLFFNASRCFAFVHDVCDDASSFPFPDDSLDVILLIFVLSSIHPDRMQGVVNRLARLLKPGGMILFRDYGRYDFSQLRFKKGCCLSENFYVRGDGTRAYFFTKDEIQNIFSSAGVTEVQNLLDRRLQVNRKKKVKMHRVWIQSKFQKQLQLTQSRREDAPCKHSS
ncbi:tRNA N(3)-methylcytidine methyltransferase METTL8, mitochondrial isoform X2 [Rhineura floridana]|uniref:tRNA N(3)-methylcytidine methyltransferase METTL8, mitochondrial isoform X2 n=2 Tax=Rhineura floridana TaxID=261503 RepID=UPI002AC7E691|nr:tRNA N(3)-methylcytidine methyltransferase METTL8, mitochondrial isoform X2 [Rhineura floridana]